MKRLLLLLAGLTLAQWSLCAHATEIPEKDWEYVEIDDDTIAIYNTDQSRQKAAIDKATAGDITVPSTLRQRRVTSIGANAFYECSEITSVVIPEGITNIANYAFYGCTSLTNVVFPSSLKEIGEDAFNGCSSLRQMFFSGCAQLSIGKEAFSLCTCLNDFTFDGDAVNIGKYAFGKCTSLTNLTLTAKTIDLAEDVAGYYDYDKQRVLRQCNELSDVTLIAMNSLTIGNSAFYWCSALVNVNSSAESLQIGSSAFYWCSALANVNISAKSLQIGARAIYGCGVLTNVTIKAEQSSTIGAGAFENCTALKEIDLPSCLTEVSSNLFSNCSSLSSISFSTNLRQIAYQAFDCCTSLANITIAEGLAAIDEQAFYGCEALKVLELPQSLSSIGARAFEKSGVSDVIIAGGDTNIAESASLTLGERVFYRCDNLQMVELPQRLTALPERGFSSCEALMTINLPSNLTSIANSAFEDCTALSTIDFPTNLLSIGSASFKGCTALTGFLIPTNQVVELGAKAFYNTKYWNDYDDNSLVVNNGYILGFKGNPTEVVLPDTCKAIPDGMFEGMSSLTSVTIPASVTSIGKRAFVGTGIRELVATNVTSVGNAAFSDCAALTNVVLSTALSGTLPGELFKNCTSLLTVYIPAGITSIGAYAFYNCSSLLEVTGGEGVTQVGDYAFAWCTALQPFEFVQEVAFGEHVYQGCTWTEHVLYPSVGTLKDEYPLSYTNIRSIVFSAGVTSLVDNACLDCRSLETVKFPSSVAVVGNNAFAGCSSLTSVVFTSSIATFGTNVFHGCGAIASVVMTGERSVKSIFDEQYQTLSDITIVSNATYLCDEMFSGCAALSTIEIPSSVTLIGNLAFFGCSALKDLTFPSSINVVSNSVFAGCSALTSVVFTSSIATFGTNVFHGCSAITSVVVAGERSIKSIFEEQYSWLSDIKISENATSLCEEMFVGCSALTTVDIPTSVTSIGASAFAGCAALKSVYFPTMDVEEEAEREDGFLEMEIEIGSSAFSNCTALTRVELPLGVKSIPNSLFIGCAALTNDSFEMPYTVTEIGEYAFANCTALSALTVPEKVTTISDYAFSGCKNLQVVRYLGAKPSSVGDNIYAHTSNALMTAWNSKESSSWSGTTGNPWTSSSRRIASWDASKMYPCCKVTFNENNGATNKVEVIYIKGRVLGLLKEDPSDGSGWWTDKLGGVRCYPYTEMTQAVYLYAHRDIGSSGGGGSAVYWENSSFYEEDEGYAYSAATFDCFMLDGESMAGLVTLTTKAGKKTSSGETNASFTVTVQCRGTGKKIKLSGTIDEDGHATAEKGDYSFEAQLGQFGLTEGTFTDAGEDGGTYEIRGARNRSKAASDSAKYAVRMALAASRGTWNVILKTGDVEDLGGGALAVGYSILSVTVDSQGKGKITGTMADGTKVSTTSTLIVGDGCCSLPVNVPLYTGKKGGFGFCLWFTWQDDMSQEDDDVSVQGLSSWDASMNKTSPFIATFEDPIIVYAENTSESGTASFDLDGSFEVSDVTIQDDLLPSGTEITITKSKWKLPKSDKVKFDRESGEWVDQTEDPLNPASLKLSFTAKTGLFKGSFKVYGVTEAGKSKSYTANVTGVYLGAEAGGYGTATIKKIGSVPVTITAN